MAYGGQAAVVGAGLPPGLGSARAAGFPVPRRRAQNNALHHVRVRTHVGTPRVDFSLHARAHISRTAAENGSAEQWLPMKHTE